MSVAYLRSRRVKVCPTYDSSLELQVDASLGYHQVLFRNTSRYHSLTLCFGGNHWPLQPQSSLTLEHHNIKGRCTWSEQEKKEEESYEELKEEEEVQCHRRKKAGVLKYVLLDTPVNKVEVPIPRGAKTMLATLVASGAGGEGALGNASGTLASRPGMGGGSGGLVSITVDLAGANRLLVTVGAGGAGGLGSSVESETVGGRGNMTSIFLYDGEELLKQLCSIGGKATSQTAGVIYTGGGAYGGGGPTGSAFALGSFGAQANGKPADATKAGDGGGLGKLNPVGGLQYGAGIGGANQTTNSTVILGGGGGGIGSGELLGAGGNGGSFQSAGTSFLGPARGEDGTLGSGGGGGSYSSNNLMAGPFVPQNGGKGGDGYAGLTFLA